MLFHSSGSVASFAPRDKKCKNFEKSGASALRDPLQPFQGPRGLAGPHVKILKKIDKFLKKESNLRRG